MSGLGDVVFVSAINHVLGKTAWARQKLLPFSGRRARLVATPFRIDFAIGPTGFLEYRSAADLEPVDVEIGVPLGAGLLVLLRDPTELMRSARVSGSADFAEALGFVLTHIRYDLEDELATWVGDIAAHRIYGLAGSLVAWQKQAAKRAAENVAEFLTEESVLLVKPTQTSRFVSDIDRLRDDVARLEKRLHRLAGG
jgi:ubiquinone biosynthesis protein UbiJ